MTRYELEFNANDSQLIHIALYVSLTFMRAGTSQPNRLVEGITNTLFVLIDMLEFVDVVAFARGRIVSCKWLAVEAIVVVATLLSSTSAALGSARCVSHCTQARSVKFQRRCWTGIEHAKKSSKTVI